MTYPVLALAFLAAAVVVGLLLPLTRGRPRPWPRWTAVGVAAVVLLVLTAAFDSLMIAAGLFHFDPAALAGMRVGRAPVEDFAYPLATVALLPALWEMLRRRRRPAVGPRSPSAGPGVAAEPGAGAGRSTSRPQGGEADS